MSKTLVTGICGFIGSHLAQRLLDDGHEVIGIDDLSAGYKENLPDGATFYKRDICDILEYDECLEGVDVIFHNAASKKNICLKDPRRDNDVNCKSAISIMEAAAKRGVKTVIWASTGSVYGEIRGMIHEALPLHPNSFYGISKMGGETYARMMGIKYGINVVVLRYFHVYEYGGGNQESSQELGGVIAIFEDKIKKGENITIHGDGHQQRCFTEVSDIVECNIRAWQNEIAWGKTYNCASEERTTVKHAALAIMNRQGKTVGINYDNPLEGDIYNFNVSSHNIWRDLRIGFKPFSEYYK